MISCRGRCLHRPEIHNKLKTGGCRHPPLRICQFNLGYNYELRITNSEFRLSDKPQFNYYSSSSVILGALRSRTIITDSAAQIRSITAKAAVSQPFVAEVLLN